MVGERMDIKNTNKELENTNKEQVSEQVKEQEVKIEILKDDKVLDIQKKLNKIKYVTLEENGILNDKTTKAIQDFKSLMGLEDDKIDNNLKFIINEILEWNGIDKTRTFAVKFQEWLKNNKE